MKENVICIEKLRLMLEKHRKEALKVLPTRTIFIDPLLEDIFSNLTDLYTTLYEFFRYCNVIKQPFIHKRIL